MQQIPTDPYVNYLEKIKAFKDTPENPNRLWKQIKRDFRAIYTSSGEIGMYSHMLKVGISIEETKAFYNRKLISYMYSKDIFDSKGMNIGGAVALAKKTNYEKHQESSGRIILGKKTSSEKYLTKLTKCTHSELLTELKNSTNLFASKDIKINPYELIIDLDAIAKIGNIRTPRTVYIQWVESFIKTGEN